MFKKAFQIFFGIALTMQLAGCFYAGHDRRDHDDHYEHHEDHDAGVDVHLHG